MVIKDITLNIINDYDPKYWSYSLNNVTHSKNMIRMINTTKYKYAKLIIMKDYIAEFIEFNSSDKYDNNYT